MMKVNILSYLDIASSVVYLYTSNIIIFVGVLLLFTALMLYT